MSKQQAVLADGKLMLSRFAVPSTVYTAEELAAIRAKYLLHSKNSTHIASVDKETCSPGTCSPGRYHGHASYMPEEWQLLEQAYHNALASERGGVAGVVLAGRTRAGRSGRIGEALTGPSFGLTVENSLAAAAVCAHSK